MGTFEDAPGMGMDGRAGFPLCIEYNLKSEAEAAKARNWPGRGGREHDPLVRS